MSNEDSQSPGDVNKTPGEPNDELDRMFSSRMSGSDDEESESSAVDGDGQHEMSGDKGDREDTTNGGEDTVVEQDSSEDVNENDEDSGEDEFDNTIKEQSDLFRGYNIDNPEDIIAAINDVEPEAARELRSIYNEKKRLESKATSLADQVEDVKEEFRTYRLQKKKQIEALEETAAKDFIKDILPVRDNLERAVEHDDIDEVREGIKMIIEGFDESLRNEGVDVIYPDRGDKVNPQVHKVMSTVKTDDVEDGHVVECYRPGYRIEDLLIRPARVSVSEE